jgi:CRISPR-associated endonuclease/helicase Cas3
LEFALARTNLPDDETMFHAHSTDRTDRSDWETVAEHAEAVADRAERFATAFGAGRAGRLAGLLHDLGKFDPRFQARLTDATVRVDQSMTGADL